MKKIDVENFQINETQELEKQEVKPKWHCDTYCRKVRHVTCEGQGHIDPNAPDRCPYLDEMLY